MEADSPEINVDELMQKIRAEVAKRRNSSPQKRLMYKPENNNLLARYNANLELMEGLLKNAELRSEVRNKWPDNLNKFPFNISKDIQKIALKILNFLFKDQREVNYNLIRALKESVALNRQLIEQVTALRAQMDHPSAAMETRLTSIDRRLTTTETRFSSIEKRLGAVDSRIPEIDRHLGAIDEHLIAKNRRLGDMDDRLNTVDTRLQAVGDRLNTTDSHLHEVNSHLQRVDERHFRNDSYLKNDLNQQKRLLSIFLEEARKRLPEPFNQEQLQTFVNEEKHISDAFYTAFEDRFRGSREEIKNRLKTYIPFVEKALASCDYAPTIDIGCGRGEWLELLSECGIKSSGVDINSTMVQYCQELNLDAVEGDGLLYLRNVPDNSLAIVSAFHVIEHLPLQTLLDLTDEALRVLRPGGIVIFETPNPENLIVGACNFYFDPTHRNPIPPATAQFLLENRGFRQVEIHRLHPVGINHNLDNQFLKDVLLCSQDYAVIGWKA
jgi:SAM-dependent methyltransferase/cell division septum initiation protein DivIVA